MKTFNDIWAYGRGWHKAYSNDFKLITKLERWQKVEPCATYMTPLGKVFAKDIIFPSSIYNRIARALGLPPKSKSPGRVRQGQRLSRSRSIGEVKSPEKTRESI